MKGYQEIFVDSVRDDAAPGWLVDAVHERWAIGLRGARLITVSENAMYALEADSGSYVLRLSRPQYAAGAGCWRARAATSRGMPPGQARGG